MAKVSIRESAGRRRGHLVAPLSHPPRPAGALRLSALDRALQLGASRGAATSFSKEGGGGFCTPRFLANARLNATLVPNLIS